jgi:hypothetical protein
MTSPHIISVDQHPRTRKAPRRHSRKNLCNHLTFSSQPGFWQKRKYPLTVVQEREELLSLTVQWCRWWWWWWSLQVPNWTITGCNECNMIFAPVWFPAAMTILQVTKTPWTGRRREEGREGGRERVREGQWFGRAKVPAMGHWRSLCCPGVIFGTAPSALLSLAGSPLRSRAKGKKASSRKVTISDHTDYRN